MSGQFKGYRAQIVHQTTAQAPASSDVARVRGDTAQRTGRLLVRNASTTAAEIIRMYFTAADFDANANFFPIIAGGEFSEPVDVEGVWLRSQSGTPLAVCVFMYRDA